MPELPEVESIRRKLSQVLAGKTIASLDLLRDKTFPDFQDHKRHLLGQKIIMVKRRAKILQFVLDNNFDFLAHLKMTGQFIYQGVNGEKIGGGHPTADWIKELPSKHSRLIFNFTDQSRLFFNDMRVFGWIRVKAKSEIEEVYSHLGPDILSEKEILDKKINQEELTGFHQLLLEKAKRRSISIKQLIMDNQVLCGVGNIYASEALFKTGISPLRPAKKLNSLEMRSLLLAMKEIVLEAIELGGTTFDGKYVDISGFAGQFQNKLKVYGQDGKNCLVCGNKILRIKLGGRSSFYCPQCQN